MAACQFCTGTHYLSDDPGLGPCVCCTPEAMQKRDRTIRELSEPPEPGGLTETLDEIGSLLEHAKEKAAEREGEIADMRAALATYLVSLGLDSVQPMGASPELAVLVDAIG